MPNPLPTPEELERQERLKWMQRIATGLLVFMFMLLVISNIGQSSYPWLAWMRAFAEAAVVGAVADWFAVVAMFRHPLKLPIPHTAIIPRNQDRIADALGNFVARNFLTPENVIRKAQTYDVPKLVATWLADPVNSNALARRAAALIPPLIEAIGDDEVRRFVKRAVGPHLDELDLSRITGEVLQVLTLNNRHHALLEEASRLLESWLTANRQLITDKFGEKSALTPRFVDHYVVKKFVEGIIALLHDVNNDPQHQVRARFDEATQELIQRLQTSPEAKEKGEALKRELVSHFDRQDYYRLVWDEAKARILHDLEREDSFLQSELRNGLTRLGAELLRDPAMLDKLNRWIVQSLGRITRQQRDQVSSLISDTVKSWDTRELTRKIELQIGKDLQYIRINGTLVGGTIGLVLHAVRL
jgi:uncharacterized membrane-anchored protein YjiN (DUF445 family)